MRAKTSVSRWILQVLLGFVAGIYILYKADVPCCRFLCILPFIYAIMSFTCVYACGVVAMDNVAGIIFNGMMLLRIVIMPVLMTVSGLRIRNTEHMEAAILLLSYEIIIEYLFTNYFFSKVKRDEFVDVTIRYDRYKGYWKIIFVFLAVMVFCLVLAPMAIGYYRTIFGIANYEYTGFDSRSITRMYATNLYRKFGLVTFRYLMNVTRVIIPAVITLYCRKKRLNRHWTGLITIVSVFVFNFLVVDDTIATSVFNALIIAIFYRKLYNTNTKGITKYFVYAFGAVVVFFVFRFSFSVSTSSFAYRISSTAQAYFGGLENISAGLSMVESSIGARFKYAIYEILRGIPYASTVFGLDSTNISTLFNKAGNSVGQIIPTICSSKLYFGYFLSPLYSLLFLDISLRESKNIEHEKKPLRLLSSIIICIYSLMGISAYSPEITWTSIICVGLITRLLSYLFEKDVKTI